MYVGTDDVALVADILEHNVREGLPPATKHSVAMDTEVSEKVAPSQGTLYTVSKQITTSYIIVVKPEESASPGGHVYVNVKVKAVIEEVFLQLIDVGLH